MTLPGFTVLTSSPCLRSRNVPMRAHTHRFMVKAARMERDPESQDYHEASQLLNQGSHP